MTHSVNWQTPSTALSNQSQPSAAKNGASTAGILNFNNLLKSLLLEEETLLQTTAGSTAGLGSASQSGIGLNNSAGTGSGFTGTGGFSMPTDLTSSLLSMMIASDTSLGIQGTPASNSVNTASSANLENPGAASVAQEISRAVSSAAQQYGLPESLLKAVIHQESGGNPAATSKTGAMGLMQLMPATAQGLGVQDPYSIQGNIDGGAKYLSQLLHQFKGNVPLALAGYNAGPAAVTHYGGIPPYAETQNYVQNILAALPSQQTPVQL